MLKIHKFERFSKKVIQLKHLRNYGEKCDPCRNPCPPSYVCKRPQTDPDFEKMMATFDFVHPALRCEKPKNYKPYRNLTLFLCIPLCICYYFNIHYMLPPRKRPKFIKFEHMRIRNKDFPWSKEGKTLFHNPYYNALPDGYEFEVPEDEEYDPRTDCPPK